MQLDVREIQKPDTIYQLHAWNRRQNFSSFVCIPDIKMAEQTHCFGLNWRRRVQQRNITILVVQYTDGSVGVEMVILRERGNNYFKEVRDRSRCITHTGMILLA